MNPAALTPRKPIRTMGTILAVISVLALFFWVAVTLVLLISPSAILSTEEVALPAEVMEEIPDSASLFFPEGVTAETTVGELMEKDRAFFESHSGFYRWTLLGWAAFFAAVAVVILRMAVGWRREDPFGRGTILGLRWLGLLFLAQFIVGLVLVFLIPSSGYGELVTFSVMLDELAFSSATGVPLSCGIVFLTLSWVVEYGQKMKEEHALTI